jgi:hypothetical protein
VEGSRAPWAYIALVGGCMGAACGRASPSPSPMVSAFEAGTASSDAGPGDANMLPAPSLADASTSGDGGTPSDGGTAGAGLRVGRYVGRGLWGVHQTGKLTVHVGSESCTATYGAEASYFCSTEHKLRCELRPDGAAQVTETSCVENCLPDRGPQRQNCAGPFGVHGVLVGVPASGADAGTVSARFLLNERLIKQLERSRNKFESLPMDFRAPSDTVDGGQPGSAPTRGAPTPPSRPPVTSPGPPSSGP